MYSIKCKIDEIRSNKRKNIERCYPVCVALAISYDTEVDGNVDFICYAVTFIWTEYSGWISKVLYFISFF